MKKLFSFILISVLVFLTLSATKTFSRRYALQAIRKTIVKEPKTTFLTTGEVRITGARMTMDYLIGTKEADAIRMMKNSGLIVINRVTKETVPPSDWYKVLELTEEGKKYLIKYEKNYADIIVAAKVKLADLKVTKVTGIQVLSEWGGGEAEFEYIFENLTPFAMCFIDFGSYEHLKEIGTGTASFSLYDDGWRLTRIEFDW